MTFEVGTYSCLIPSSDGNISTTEGHRNEWMVSMDSYSSLLHDPTSCSEVSVTWSSRDRELSGFPLKSSKIDQFQNLSPPLLMNGSSGSILQMKLDDSAKFLSGQIFDIASRFLSRDLRN